MDNEMTGLSEVKKNAEDMKTGAAVYKGADRNKSQLHSFNPDAPVDFVKSAKENLVQSVKAEFERDPVFKERLLKELSVTPVAGLLDVQDIQPTKEQASQEIV